MSIHSYVSNLKFNNILHKGGLSMNETFTLLNLGCANCAQKIETKLYNTDGIQQATLNFVTKKLIVDYDVNKFTSTDQLLQKIDSIANSIESGIQVILEKGQYTTSTVANQHCKDEHCHCNHTHSDRHDHNHGHKESKGHNHQHQQAKSHLELILLVSGTLLGVGTLLFSHSDNVTTLLILISYLLMGSSVIRKSINNVLHGEIFDENFLVVIATVGAFFIREYPEALAVLLLFQIGELLQDKAVDNSRKQLTNVLSIKPDYANIESNNGLTQVAPESVNIGDIIVVKPSEKIPLDGIVVEGSSFIDTSSLTGESVPRRVNIDDEILSGCINGNQTLKIKVTKTYSESTVAKVLDLVENATNRKSATENFITKFSRYYTPIVVLLAILLAIVPPIVTGTYEFSRYIYSACGFLVVSCPCALVISVPLGFFGGIGAASKRGVLIKGSNYLEALSHVETIVFDKTGTLTRGTFSVKEIHIADDTMTEEQFITTAATIESFSTHPIAESITQLCNVPLNTSSVTNYNDIPGLGVKAHLNDVEYYIGNQKLMEQLNIPYSLSVSSVLGTIVYIAEKNKFLGYILISDEIKDDSKRAISSLRSEKIDTVMLTGDRKEVATEVAKQLTINTVYSELLPSDKVDKLEAILSRKNKSKKVAFVGDGVNDAPVIARSDVGIAMGGVGSDAAIEAADVVIMTDEPIRIAEAIKIARKTKRIVTENIILALGVKLLILALLACNLGSMWLAVFGDVGVSLIAIFNSLRVLSTKKLSIDK